MMTPEPKRIDLALSMTEAREHYGANPPPGGREMADLMKGPDAPDGPQRCLWPACYRELKEMLGYLEPNGRERFLWSLYHFQEGGRLPFRWLFWRVPPKTYPCRNLEPAFYPERFPAEDYGRFGDGVACDSAEGRRRAQANIREIRRRIGSKTRSTAEWQAKTEKHIAHLRDLIASGGLGADIVEKHQRQIDRLEWELERSRPGAKAWDFLNGREIDEVVTVPETLEDFDWEADSEEVPF